MAVIATDEQGCVQSANAAADLMFGSALVTRPPRRVTDILIGLPETLIISPTEMDAFNARDRPGPRTVRKLRRVDGAETPVDLQAARFMDGERPFLTIFIQDISAVLMAEEKAHNLRLQLINDWRANSLGEMASVLSHELNQPLAAVTNSLHGVQTLLGRTPLEKDRALALVDAADGQIERARQILIHMRKLAWRDKGHHSRQPVLPMLKEISPILELSARATRALVELDVSEEDAVHGDRVQLQQLIVNLVRNALDAPATADRRLVRIHGRRLAGSAYALTVSDNGPGVTSKILPHLFEPMISIKPSGMGLGLSICETIARAHDGKIFHSPSADGGAAFTVTLRTEPVGSL